MSAFVSFSIAGIDCDAAKAMLTEWGITIGKNGVAYTPIDLDQRGIPHILRASVHLDTDAGAITRLAAAITHLAVGVRPGQSDKA
jgi:cysteine desulfurase / selenocysteine lyase